MKQLQTDAIDEKPISQLLASLLLLPEGEISKEDIKWANLELKGYRGNENEIPAYRSVKIPVLANGEFIATNFKKTPVTEDLLLLAHPDIRPEVINKYLLKSTILPQSAKEFEEWKLGKFADYADDFIYIRTPQDIALQNLWRVQNGGFIEFYHSLPTALILSIEKSIRERIFSAISGISSDGNESLNQIISNTTYTTTKREAVDSMVRDGSQPNRIKGIPLAYLDKPKNLSSRGLQDQDKDITVTITSKLKAFLDQLHNTDISYGRRSFLERYPESEILGKGGFGVVYRIDYETVIKVIPKQVPPQKEVEIANNQKELLNVFPVDETEEYSDGWGIRMPLASDVFSEYLKASEPSVSVAIQLGLSIGIALSSLEQHGLVHRDIKPANILKLDGKWLLADFGIVKYLNESTGTNTFKEVMSTLYASPEQIRHEEVSYKSDIYSLGCVLYESVTGKPPFNGKTESEIRRQHKNEIPIPLGSRISRLDTLISQCLMKQPEKRPSAGELIEVLNAILVTKIEDNPLISAINMLQEEDSTSEAFEIKKKSAERKEKVVFLDAQSELEGYFRQLENLVTEGINQRFEKKSLHIGKGELTVGEMVLHPVKDQKRKSAFQVLASSSIGVHQSDFPKYLGRMHSLWYCNFFDREIFEWVEMGFSWVGKSENIKPFALPPSEEVAIQLIEGIMGSALWGWCPTPLQDRTVDDFSIRWRDWFVQTVTGDLREVPRSPEN